MNRGILEAAVYGIQIQNKMMLYIPTTTSVRSSGNKINYRVCMLIPQSPALAGFYCDKLNFIISKLVYYCTEL